MRNKAFTVSELLVVMGIVAVLAGILLPIISRAKENGYKTASLLQSKQLGQALKIYADDNDGGFALSTNYGVPTTSKNRIWTAALKAITKDEKVFVAPGTDGLYTESWDKRGWLSIGYNSVTAIDKVNGCPDDISDSTGCQAFKSSLSFDQSDNLAAVALFSLTPCGEVGSRYRGYEFNPYNGTPIPGLSFKNQPPLASDIDLVKEAPANQSAELLEPIYARYGSGGDLGGSTPIIFADSHAKSYTAKEILTGSEHLVWRFR